MIKIKKIINDFYEIHIFGDSHAKCFYRDPKIELGNVTMFNHYKGSVSMKGLTNPNSRLKYGEYIIEKLKSINNNVESKNICVMKFGQVDIEYNYYFKLSKNQESVNKDEFYNTIIKNYISHIKFLESEFKNIKFVINGTNMPNLYDIRNYIKTSIGFDPNEITYEEQYNNHYIFNQKLKEMCDSENITYFDLTDETTVNKKVKPEFVGKDNHFSGGEYVKIYNQNTYDVFVNKLINTII